MSTGGAQRDDDPVMTEAAEAVASVVQRFTRARLPIEERELEQLAWLAVLENMHRYDPTSGSARAYFFVVARREVGMHVTRLLCPARLSRGAAKSGVGADIRSAPVEDVDGGVHLDAPVQRPRSPEEEALAVEREEARARRWVKVCALIDECMQDWNEYDRYLANRLTGLDGYETERPNELAKRLRIDIARVYRVHARLEKALWNNHKLYLLHRNTEPGGEESE